MIKHVIFALAALLFSASFAVAQNQAITGNLLLGCGTATGTSNASTLANKCGIITTESATTAAAATFTETITDTVVAATDICFASVTTTGTGTPVITKVTPAAGSLVVIVGNVHASAAFNAVLLITFLCFKA